MRDNPSRKASRQEISQVSHNAARRDIARDFSQEISCETSISSTVPNYVVQYLHTCILTLKYVQTYLPTCKVPYAVSTGLAIQGLRDNTNCLPAKTARRAQTETTTHKQINSKNSHTWLTAPPHPHDAAQPYTITLWRTPTKLMGNLALPLLDTPVEAHHAIFIIFNE